MKLAVVMGTVLMLMFAVVIGGPTSMAQDDPETAPATDQELPPCPQAPDLPPDETMDPEAIPPCTPAAATGIPPESVASTDTPTPAPTDTPVPTETPVPTATPVPTDTPQPATPTPVPPLPTETPTPTSESRDVPVGTLSRQLPFANPGEDVCEIDLTTTNLACNPQTYPALFKIAFAPSSSDARVAVQVDDGAARPANLDRLGRWDFLSVPGQSGPGIHMITLAETLSDGGALSGTVKVTVGAANSPHLLVYPRNIRPGSSAKVFLAGFPADTTLPLGVYRERQDCNAFGQGNECYELVRELGTIKTDGAGTATRDFSVAANETPATYLIGTPGLKIDPHNAAETLKTFGRPWFVVPQL